MFAFLKAVGVSLTNLDVPFTMNALFLPNVFCSQTELTTQIINHYTNEGIMQGRLLPSLPTTGYHHSFLPSLYL
jgi:hypothetical protein